MQFWQIVGLALIVLVLGCGEPHASTRSLQKPSSEIRPEHSEPKRERDPFEGLGGQGSSDRMEIDSDDFLNFGAPFDPPLSPEDKISVLQQCINKVLLDPAYQGSREFYGTAGQETVYLVDGQNHKWPKDFNPTVKGFRVRLGHPDVGGQNENRMLGLRLQKIDLSAPSINPLDGNFVVSFENVGGYRNGVVIGGQSIHYCVSKQNGRFVVKLGIRIDP